MSSRLFAGSFSAQGRGWPMTYYAGVRAFALLAGLASAAFAVPLTAGASPDAAFFARVGDRATNDNRAILVQ